MTKEYKELLFLDLRARLPYGVICTDCRHGDSRITQIDINPTSNEISVYYWDFDEYGFIENCKPYLRPMSSMTEEEKMIQRSKMRYEGYFVNHVYYHTLEEFEYLNSIHVDYRTDDEGKTMIEKGLALEAPEGMYKNNNKI